MKKIILFFFVSPIFPITVFCQWNQVTTQDCYYGGATQLSEYIFDINRDSCIAMGRTFVTFAPNPPERFYVCGTKNEFISIKQVAYNGYSASEIKDVNYISDTSANIIFTTTNAYYIGYSSNLHGGNYSVPTTAILKVANWQNQYAYLLFSEADSISLFCYNKNTHAIQQQKVFYNTGSTAYGMTFINDSTGYISLWDNISNTCVIYKTANYGVTWNSINTNPNSLNDLFFPSQTTGYAVGSTGTVLKTTNAGISWTTVSFPTQDTLLCVHFLNSSIGYMGAKNGAIYKTLDGGINWTQENSGVTNSISKIKMVNNGSAYFVSHNALYKNTSAYTTSIADVKLRDKIILYPNPATDNLQVEIANLTGIIKLQITNAMGQEVISTSLDFKQGNTIVDISVLQQGVYFIKTPQGTQKFIKL